MIFKKLSRQQYISKLEYKFIFPSLDSTKPRNSIYKLASQFISMNKNGFSKEKEKFKSEFL